MTNRKRKLAKLIFHSRTIYVTIVNYSGVKTQICGHVVKGTGTKIFTRYSLPVPTLRKYVQEPKFLSGYLLSLPPVSASPIWETRTRQSDQLRNQKYPQSFMMLSCSSKTG